jgi:hypothetical protein
VNRIVWVLGWALTVSAGCASYALTSGQVAVRDDTVTRALRIDDRDRSILRDYYRDPTHHGKNVLGLAGQERLPPGFARRDVLPGDVRGHALPYELDARLAPLPAGYLRLMIGHDVVLLHRDSRIVLDIASGVIP